MEEVFLSDDEVEEISRFAINSEKELETHQQIRVPNSTRSKQQSCVRLFKSWHSQWKMRGDMLKVYDDLEYMGASDLSYCLKYFIADVRKKNGKKYPPKTLKGIYAMIQHYVNYDCKKNWSFFRDPDFKEARDQLDAEMRLSAAEGNVKPTKRADPISFEDEEALWAKGILGSGNPKQLQCTVIYLMGIQLGLRAATEHKALQLGDNSQFQLLEEEDDEVLVYTECVSKNKHHGIQQSRLEPKTIKIFPRKTDQRRCLISLYKEYISHRPPTVRNDFHLACIVNPKSSTWYKNQPLGIHSIEKVTKSLMTMLGRKGHFTNTSLRRTSKTRLVEAGIPREVSKKRIGHISNIDEVYVAETSMERQMSMILTGEIASSSSIISNDVSAADSLSNDNGAPGTFVFNNCTFSGCKF